MNRLTRDGTAERLVFRGTKLSGANADTGKSRSSCSAHHQAEAELEALPGRRLEPNLQRVMATPTNTHNSIAKKHGAVIECRGQAIIDGSTLRTRQGLTDYACAASGVTREESLAMDKVNLYERLGRETIEAISTAFYNRYRSEFKIGRKFIYRERVSSRQSGCYHLILRLHKLCVFCG